MRDLSCPWLSLLMSTKEAHHPNATTRCGTTQVILEYRDHKALRSFDPERNHLPQATHNQRVMFQLDPSSHLQFRKSYHGCFCEVRFNLQPKLTFGFTRTVSLSETGREMAELFSSPLYCTMKRYFPIHVG